MVTYNVLHDDFCVTPLDGTFVYVSNLIIMPHKAYEVVGLLNWPMVHMMYCEGLGCFQGCFQR